MPPESTTSPLGFVLVHGAELGAWLWELLTPLLSHTAVAVDLPGRGTRPADPRAVALSDAVDAVADDAEHCDADRVILVAHSFSGVVIPPVVDRLGDRVAAVVFLGATVPEEGRSWVDLLPAAQRIPLRVLYRLRPGGMLSPAGQNRKTLCNDLDADSTDTFLERRVVEPPRLLLDKVSPATLPRRLPVHYVRLTRDRAVTEEQRTQAFRRLHEPQIHDLPSGHLPMLSQPAALAALLDRIADSAGADHRRA